MAETKRKRGSRKRRIDPGLRFVLLMLAAFFVVAIAFIANSIHHLLTTTGTDDAIAFKGGFGLVFLIVTLFMTLELWTKTAFQSPWIICAIAVSGFVLGLAGLLLYYYDRISVGGIFIGFFMAAFPLSLASMLWKNYVKKKYG